MLARDLEPERREQWRAFRTALAELGAADAERWDEAGRIPPEVVSALGARGLLGTIAPKNSGGSGLDALGLGLLAEAAGAVSGSLASLFTVHSMVIHAVDRFGGTGLKDSLLPRLARGETLGSFALSEPDAGSDINGISMQSSPVEDGIVLTGVKTWLSFGRDAGAFLVFARSDSGPLACIVTPDDRGVSVEAIDDMVGFRAARLATLRLDGTPVPASRRIGRPGLGLVMVALGALNWGRVCIAWASCGAQRACIDAVVRHVTSRKTSRGTLADEPGVQSALGAMRLRLDASQTLALAATTAFTRKDDDGAARLMGAKLFASAACAETAARATELLGAIGSTSRTPVARHLRDAKVLEVIEGTNDVLRIFLGERTIAEGRNPLF